MQNVVPIGEGDSVDVPQDSDSQLQEQEKRIEISCALATEASRRGRMLSGERGWASLRQGHQLTRCRGGSAVLSGGAGSGRWLLGSLSTDWVCAGLNTKGPEWLTSRASAVMMLTATS